MFNFKELKNKTFCIYDIKSEAQGKEVQRILDDELGMEECGNYGDKYFGRSFCTDENRYFTGSIFGFNSADQNKKDYKATATQFLKDYEEWKVSRELTHDELLEHIKKHGIIAAEITEKFHDIPAGTLMYFGKYANFISSLSDDVDGRNNIIKYDTSWCKEWKNDYAGKFKILTLPTGTLYCEEPHYKQYLGKKYADKLLEIAKEDNKEQNKK